MPSAHLAIDFGASSGRAMLGVLDDEPKILRLTEVHRFEHAPLSTPVGPVWDLTTLWRELLVGLRLGSAAAQDAGIELVSIGVDTWAVDWVLVEPGGELLGLSHNYRDPSHVKARERLLSQLPGGSEGLYARTGIQPQPFNTLFQIEARRHASPELFASLPVGSRLLMLPDLFHYWLTGVMSNERTNASTTSMLSAVTGDWDPELLDVVGLLSDVMPELADAGDTLGTIRPELATELGIPEGICVVLPATHDTASAVAAVPSTGEASGSWAFLSSGTWSLLGVEIENPITTPHALAVPFTNERGVADRTRFLRNIAGLWLVQELRRDLAKHGDSFDFGQLASLAEEASPLRSLVDSNRPEFAEHGDMIAKLRGLAREAGQPEPETPGQLARCCLESLALCYAETIDRIESLTSVHIGSLYLVGGGVNNDC